MVLHKTDLKKGNVSLSKLMCNWEGPFKVAKVIRLRAFKLAYLNEKAILRSLNIVNLRKFYQYLVFCLSVKFFLSSVKFFIQASTYFLTE